MIFWERQTKTIRWFWVGDKGIKKISIYFGKGFEKIQINSYYVKQAH